MRLKDELMQVRVDTFDTNQKFYALKQEALVSDAKASRLEKENEQLKRDSED
jgi:hypothetical protein